VSTKAILGNNTVINEAFRKGIRKGAHARSQGKVAHQKKGEVERRRGK